MEEIKNLNDLNDYFESIKNYKINVVCNKSYDDYILTITAFSEQSDNEAMIINKIFHSSTYISIHIDSDKFIYAYNNLKEEEKIPPQHNIINPCLKENYMSYMVESKYLEIMKNLKMFNDKEDDYTSIAKLAVTARGYALFKQIGI